MVHTVIKEVIKRFPIQELLALDRSEKCFLPHNTREVGYYHISSGVRVSARPSVRQCSPFPTDIRFFSWDFFKFCIHIIRDEWYGIVNGQTLSFLTEKLPLLV